MRNAMPLLAAIALLALTGCPPETRTDPLAFQSPRDAQQTLASLNRNLEGIQGALTAPASISVSFRDDRGVPRSMNGYDATLIYQAPRCLYLNIKHPLAGSIAKMGTNDERYWLLVDFEDNKNLMWGSWQALEAGRNQPLPVPPDRLIQTLFMQPVDDRLPGGLPPLLATEMGQKTLLFSKRNPSGWLYVARKVRLSSKAPHLPVEIIDQTSDGQVVMRAQLSDHKPISGTTDTWTARTFRIEWPVEEASMTLRLQDVKYRTKDYPFCEFPEDWQGPSRSLDLTSVARSEN